MCDKIPESDPRYPQVRATIVEQTGCIEVHDVLEACLQTNGKDWRKCQMQVQELGKCVRRNSSKLARQPI